MMFKFRLGGKGIWMTFVLTAVFIAVTAPADDLLVHLRT